MKFELLQQKLESMICHAGWHKTPLWPGEAVYTECRVEAGEGSSLSGAPFTLELAAVSLNSMPDGRLRGASELAAAWFLRSRRRGATHFRSHGRRMAGRLFIPLASLGPLRSSGCGLEATGPRRVPFGAASKNAG